MVSASCVEPRQCLKRLPNGQKTRAFFGPFRLPFSRDSRLDFSSASHSPVLPFPGHYFSLATTFLQSLPFGVSIPLVPELLWCQHYSSISIFLIPGAKITCIS